MLRFCLPVSAFEASFNYSTPMEALKSSMNKMHCDSNLLTFLEIVQSLKSSMHKMDSDSNLLTILEIVQGSERPVEVLIERAFSDSLPLFCIMYNHIDVFFK